jgi:glycosyltransferase involved in cell wall biosynthesis
LVEQSNSYFTWLVIDDGSKDKTYEMLENYAKKDVAEV